MLKGHNHCVLACGQFMAMLLSLVPYASDAQSARIETHPLKSLTLSDQQFLSGKGNGMPVTIIGELRDPEAGTNRLPAVILLHGSSGISAREHDWVVFLDQMRVATFLVDSFTGRGIVNTANNQAQLGRLAMIIDAFRALEMLGSHPLIDPKRIAVMGFSRGGQAALYSALMRFQHLYLPTPGLKFAAHIVFYSPCNTRYATDDKVTDSPIRIFQVDNDDFVALEPVQAYVKRLRDAGADVQLTVYPGARHMFDSTALSTPHRMPGAQLSRRCELEEGSSGRIMNHATGQPFSYQDDCVDTGATVSLDHEALSQAREAVRGLLTRALALDGQES